MSGLANAEAARAALASGEASLVWQTVSADCLTPVAAALRLMRPARGDFLLESVEGGEQRGRYSLLGLDPDLVIRAHEGRAGINRDWPQDRDAFEPLDQPPLNALRALHTECRIDVPDGLPPALSVLVGYLGYEMFGLVETVPRAAPAPPDTPDMMFVRPRLLIVFDAVRDELSSIVPLWPGRGDPAGRVDRAAERIEAALAELAAPQPVRSDHANHPVPELEPTMPASEYLAMVGRAKEHIVAGDVFQVVLSQRFTCSFALPPMALYRSLRRVNPSPFLFLLDFPGFAVVGSSPEILVRVRDGVVTVRPIAGTRPRGDDPERDRAAERDLLSDPKERAEHLMLLDLGRNDAGRVSEGGSVAVTERFAIERYSHVMHIVSNVTGRLAADKDAMDALFAGFPAGTVSGAPKIRACELIAELEPATRGVYAGGVGYLAPDGSIDSCIALRTGVLKDGVLHIQAGAGIVADSDPEAEHRECHAKAGALLTAAKEAVRIAGEPGFGQ